MSVLRKRRAYREITYDTISEVPDNLLTWAVFDHIWVKVDKDYERTLQVLKELPPGFSVVYHLFALNAEISNGGFNQYFFNGLDRDVEQQLEALGQIGAIRHQEVVQDAFSRRDEEKRNEELQRRYVERTIESFFSTYEITSLNECDEAWYALSEELHALMVQYIRENPELFVTAN